MVTKQIQPMKHLHYFDNIQQEGYDEGTKIVLTNIDYSKYHKPNVEKNFIPNNIYTIFLNDYNDKEKPYNIISDNNETIWVNEKQIRLATPEEINSLKYNI
jgi:hypothetical protein